MRPSPAAVARQRLQASLGAEGENLEIGRSRLPVFREPKVSTRTDVRLNPGTGVPLLETRAVGQDVWHRVSLPPAGSGWVVGSSGGITYAYATSASPRQAPGVERSVNGWPVIQNNERSKLEVVRIPGVKTPLYAAPGAAKPLAAMVQWWHNNVAPVRLLGSHNARPLTGSQTAWSNHASGTAVDINGCYRQGDGSLPRGCSHPYREATVPDRLKPAIRAKARELGLRWGGDYKKAPLDEMHFEVAMDPAEFRSFWSRRGMPSLAPESMLTRARDTALSLPPGSEPLTREARVIKDVAGNMGVIVGAGVVAGVALWAIFGRNTRSP